MEEYGTVIQEQGDLGLGLYPINESEQQNDTEEHERNTK